MRTKAVYLGFDPGASGGIAVVATDGVNLLPMPATRGDLWEWVRYFQGRPTGHVIAAVEKVNGYGGNKAGTGSSMFKFGGSHERCLFACHAAGIEAEEVPPQVWQKAFTLKKASGETPTQWKNRIRATAQRLFPRETITLATADALLIAEWLRRKREGRL